MALRLKRQSWHTRQTRRRAGRTETAPPRRLWTVAPRRDYRARGIACAILPLLLDSSKNVRMADDPTISLGPQNPQDPDGPLTLGATAAPARNPLLLPTRIGRYRIIRLLGEGGMGAVYEAEQDQPRRRVALKVIKTAWASDDLLRRFELESQTLGRL